jgi:TrfB plasmid transcriptional repressor
MILTMKKHRITPLEFARVQSVTRMHPESLGIVRLVLVDGQSQAQVHRNTGKSRQNISLMVNTFWSHFERIHALPDGWRTESVSLPEKDWSQVRQLEQKAKAALVKKGMQRQRTSPCESSQTPKVEATSTGLTDEKLGS